MENYKEENEQYILESLKRLEQLDPNMLDMIYPISSTSLEFLYGFNEYFDINCDFIKYDQMDLKTNIKLVREFLLSMDEKYLNIFDKSLNDGTFDIFHIDNINEYPYRLDEPVCIEEKEPINVNVPLKYSITDGAILVHEFFHFLNSNKKSASREIFTELISFYMKLRYYLFINEKGYGIENYYKTLCDIMENTCDAANNVMYSSSILDIYNNTGNVTEDNIEFINEYRGLYDYNIEDILSFRDSEELGELVYDFEYDVSYLIGGIVAINLLKEPYLNDIKIKYINENFDKLSIRDVFNILNIELENMQPLITYCFDLFKQIEGALYEDNSNSRTYRSR